MSVLFPKVNKPREWDYRPIYYDPKKDERKQRLAKKQRERDGGKEGSLTSLHRGSFRESHEVNKSRYNARAVSKLAFWIALLVMLLVFLYVIL